MNFEYKILVRLNSNNKQCFYPLWFKEDKIYMITYKEEYLIKSLALINEILDGQTPIVGYDSQATAESIIDRHYTNNYPVLIDYKPKQI